MNSHGLGRAPLFTPDVMPPYTEEEFEQLKERENQERTRIRDIYEIAEEMARRNLDTSKTSHHEENTATICEAVRTLSSKLDTYFAQKQGMEVKGEKSSTSSRPTPTTTKKSSLGWNKQNQIIVKD